MNDIFIKSRMKTVNLLSNFSCEPRPHYDKVTAFQLMHSRHGIHWVEAERTQILIQFLNLPDPIACI